MGCAEISSLDVCGAETSGGLCARPSHSRGWHDPKPPTLTVPRDAEGRPRVSVSQFRRYGAVDLASGGEEGAETVRGCPRAYASVYDVDRPVPEFRSRAAELGSVLHRVLHHMEVNVCGPQEALGSVWPATLGVLDFGEATRILDGYLARGGPLTMYATLATELDLTEELYVDDDHGPVMFRGIVDCLAVDPSDPGVVHVTDFKSSARPVSKDSLRGDVQLMGYVWLIRQWWKREHGCYPDRVIAHFDQLRYSDIAIEYTTSELGLWREWASAMCRTMLRDDDPQPVPNDGCGWCPVRHTCPAWLGLPGEGETALMRLMASTPAELGDRWVEAARVLRLLDRLVTDQKSALEAETHVVGSLRVGDQEWKSGPGTKNVVDVVQLAYLLFPDHLPEYEVAVSASRASLERAVQGLDLSLADQVLACCQVAESGMRITRVKAEAQA